MMAPVASVSLAGILAGIEWVRPPALGHVFFFFNDTAAAEVFALSLLDALPISLGRLAVSLMLPEPAAVQVPPPAPTGLEGLGVGDGRRSARVPLGLILGTVVMMVVVVGARTPGGVASFPVRRAILCVVVGCVGV